VKTEALPLILCCLSTISLAACGGGDGGGSSATPAPAASTAPTTPTSSGVPVPATFQAAGTTVTYSVDSASAAIVNGAVTGTNVNPAGAGSTVTLSTDANGNISQVRFNIPTPGTTFSQSYSASQIAQAPTLTLANLTTVLAAVNATSGVNGFVGGGATLSGLSYSTYGLWAQNNGASGLFGAIDAGIQTAASSMPRSGSATYNGQTIGAAASGSAAYALTGNVNLAANFANNTINTTISGIQLENTATHAVSSVMNVSGTGAISGNHYAGTLAGGTLSGNSVGSFYGPAAQETAGAWRVSGGGLTAIGSYGAKQ
jgi:hypothetical protein